MTKSLCDEITGNHGMLLQLQSHCKQWGSALCLELADFKNQIAREELRELENLDKLIEKVSDLL